MMNASMAAFRRWAKDKTLSEVLKYSHGDTFAAGYASGKAEADIRHRETLTSWLHAQRKLRRVEAILQAMAWNGRGVQDTYANWVRGQLKLALELPEPEKEQTT